MTCLRKHFLSYVVGLRRIVDEKPLRMGKVFHIGLDLRAKGLSSEKAVTEALKFYDTGFDNVAEESLPDWLLEREIVGRLLSGYFWRWSEPDHQIKILESERFFEMPIVNPDTGRSSRTYRAFGVVDKIGMLPDNRLTNVEHKTTSTDLSPESDYWKRLRIDSQISMYVLAAQYLGYDINTTLYDVTRKPTLAKPITLTQKATAELILSGRYLHKFTKDEKLTVIDTYDVKYDKVSFAVNAQEAQIVPGKKGFAIIETLEMYGDRLTADIARRPDFYFARREIHRLESDLDDARYELWQTAKILRDCYRHGRWPRNTGACIGYGTCPYFDLCTNGYDPESGLIPEGYEIAKNVHPELEQKENNNESSTNKTADKTQLAATV